MEEGALIEERQVGQIKMFNAPPVQIYTTTFIL